mmetsp:Transcript_2142/g.4856  ORF Transcript_2142/g.4856 Transcript_2142/m.4856 type:complete len:343 (+) Transcript_2142:48-1076(+)
MGAAARATGVETLLREAGLVQFAEPLLSRGFGDVDALARIGDADMRAVGMGPCHMVRLRRSLRRHGEPDATKAVVAFLQEAGLPQYAEALLRSGFDELETLLEIEDSDMKDLGMLRGHAVKLRRRLREFKGGSQEHDFRQASPLTRSGASLPGRTAVERSWEQVQALGTFTVAERLYRHTFKAAPDAIELFSPEVRLKYRDWLANEDFAEGNVTQSPALRKLFSKFVNAIGSTVAGLHDLNRLVPMLTQLGARHANYRVDERHWPIMGKALMCTLRDCLGSSFTAEVESAWSLVYSYMSNIMIQGLRGAIAGRDAASIAAGIADGKDAWSRRPLEVPRLTKR